jgi:hypothetical protein
MKYRKFSEKKKQAILREHERGESLQALGKKHRVHPVTIGVWNAGASTKGIGPSGHDEGGGKKWGPDA